MILFQAICEYILQLFFDSYNRNKIFFERELIMRLKEIREKSELTQFAVSNQLKVSRGTYAMWEVEKDIIPLKRLLNFCIFFKVSVDYALGFTNEPNYPNSKKRIDLNITKERLRKIRKEHKHTQEYIGKLFSLDRSLISKYEKGSTLISTTFLIEYVKLYEISADYLLGLIDKKITVKPSEIILARI